MNNAEVIQIGNLVDDTNIGFKNPQRGRVYSIDGISPCLNCRLEPKIILYEKDKGDIRTVKEQRQEGESGQKDA